MYKGIGVSEGIAVSKAYVLRKRDVLISEKSKISLEKERLRYKCACEQFVKNTQALVEQVKKKASLDEAEILEGHIMILSDEEITKGVEDALQRGNTAEYGVNRIFEAFAEVFASMDDELMSQRAIDLIDIKTVLLRLLSGEQNTELESIDDECILLCHDLTPSDMGRLDKEKVRGIVSEGGGTTSHLAILSRAMGIPTVLGVKGIVEHGNNGDPVIVDGGKGVVIVHPSHEELATYSLLQKQLGQCKQELDLLKDEPASTKDGHKIELFANIGGIQDLDNVLKSGAEGIGLFRTEFLFMDRDSPPTEEDQFSVYCEVAKQMNGKTVIIRTLDIGGDKEIPYLGVLSKEDNPFLGHRAIRMCLQSQELFIAQLRAVLRAGLFGNIKIMFPLIATLSELRQAKTMFQVAKEQLREENIMFCETMETGIMVETPSASLIADILAKECDFFSIGTNDLIQYTMAADRGNPKVQYLYSPFQPAVLRSIYHIIQAGKKEGIWVGLCGECGADENMIPFLIAAGLDEISMNPSSILKARKLISALSKKELEESLHTILSIKTEEEVSAFLRRFNLH